jgi:secreted protein with Ig-like and vWFA domain
LKATSSNVAKIETWVKQFQGGGGTMPENSLLAALKLKPDAIYLLTDGQFDPAVVDTVTKENKKKVVINTIGFMYPAAEPLLKKLADENKGKYRFVP